MKIRRRIMVRCISFAVAMVIASVCFIIVTNSQISKLRTRVEYGYSMNLNELDGSLNNISLALKKAVYASTATQLSSIAVELCTESTIAKNSLSQLPYSGEYMSNINKFLSQVGDYTLYLSKKVIQGNTISAEERENLQNMSRAAQTISTSVGTVRAEYDRGGVWTEELSAGIEGSVDSSLTESFTGLEELLADYPSLVYDGPFSDHMLNGTLKMIDGKSEVNESEAKEKAASALGIDVQTLEKAEDTSGKLPCYNFYSGDMGISVTKQGGYIVYMRKFRTVTEQKFDYDQAVEIAKNYLNSSTGGSFVSTYYFADEGVCTVNLAHKEGATVCYPDLIKVGVALDTGEVVLVEAAGYLANHYTRTISTPKYSSEEAKSVLSDKMTVKSVRRAIIPTDGNSEKHCYEFDCIGVDGDELLVYVNVANLEEEKILLLLKTDGGVLTK